MVETQAELPFTGDRVGLFRAQPGRPKLPQLGTLGSIEGDDILGDGVNIAARLEGIAEPGGICISEDAFRQVRGKVEAEFADLGEQSLKNITRPVHVYAIRPTTATSTRLDASGTEPAWARRFVSPRHVVIAVALIAVVGIANAVWWAWPQRNAPAVAVPIGSPQSPPGSTSVAIPRLSFVVLPFENLSRDPDQEYFADGITDDLTTDLLFHSFEGHARRFSLVIPISRRTKG
jgi:hypothetical protein